MPGLICPAHLFKPNYDDNVVVIQANKLILGTISMGVRNYHYLHVSRGKRAQKDFGKIKI